MVNHIHPTAIIGDGVTLGDDVTIGPGAVVLGPAVVQDGCWIGPGCVIGTPPEITDATHNRAWEGDLAHHGVHLGEGVTVRELTTIQQGSRRPTSIGAGSWVLSRVYIAHDCEIGPHATLSAGVSLGGHTRIGDGVNVGMNAVVHQWRVVGPGAMVGMGSVVSRDVPPFAKAFGSPARLHGVNAVGMSRAGYSETSAQALETAYERSCAPVAVPDELRSAFDWWADSRPERPMVAAVSACS
ncbi:UDP-N-acetylglucosamine acyltransferase [Saccharothrix hoggarensis]|uniref:UDP-N-acetylglucosamine acyltransferase n=1 Tax=Saccharothrix hoggarensis TaxID=913853 RepID=A0ABW3QSK3_9PSEU